jgi:hypothetical protein
VLFAAESRVEHGDQLIADELVDRPIVIEDGPAGDPIEALQERVEVAR